MQGDDVCRWCEADFYRDGRCCRCGEPEEVVLDPEAIERGEGLFWFSDGWRMPPGRNVMAIHQEIGHRLTEDIRRMADAWMDLNTIVPARR